MMLSKAVFGLCCLCLSLTGASHNLGIRQATDTTNPCGSDATCSASGLVSEYSWRNVYAPSTFTAFTVVTIINTVSNTTTISTAFADHPDDFTPPETAPDGRKIQTLTYDANGVKKSTVVTYPTLFFDWDTQYAVTGTLALTQHGEVSCVTLSTSSIVPISGDPQPGPPRNTDPPNANGLADPDVLGWGYTLDWDLQEGNAHFISLIDLLPENSGLPHSAVRACGSSSAVPVNGKFDASWMAVGASSVTHVGNDQGGGGGGGGGGESPPTTPPTLPPTTPPATPGPGPTTPPSNTAPVSQPNTVPPPDTAPPPDTTPESKAEPNTETAGPGRDTTPVTNSPATEFTPAEITPLSKTSSTAVVTAFAMSIPIPMSSLFFCGVAGIAMLFM